jgi:putative hemolysin
MIGLNIELAVVVLFLLFLFFLSLVESAITQSSPLVLRMMMERPDKPEFSLLPAVLEDKMRILVPLHLGTQVSLIAIAVLLTHLSLRAWPEHGLIFSFVAIVLLSAAFRQLLPRLLTQNEPEIKLVQLLRWFHPVYIVLRPLAMPMSRILNLCRRLHEEVADHREPDAEETSGEEMQAYLEIGEDEGILQEEDTKLIQSVVEFGNTLVRKWSHALKLPPWAKCGR